MITEIWRSWWRRLVQKWPWRQKGLPVWGEGSPKVLGLCRRCGAMVLEGWHQKLEDGYLCQRCAGSLPKEKNS